MTETAEKTKTGAQENTPEKPDIQRATKPEFPPDMAKWLVTKLDCPVELNNHEDRNNFAACVNQLIAIANWKEAE